MISLDDITKKILSYNSEADTALIIKAYEFAEKAHQGQKRRSGQPFLIHPLEVANILADMKLDVASVCVGILHDTIEDTGVTKEEIGSLFGSDIAEIVDGVTKLSKLQFHTREERQAENFRKMIIAMSRDIRVILIKLADRLNNLRTLQFMDEEKQMSIAQETLDIYAPLANRLGIQWMKDQFEDLSFRFIKPDIFRQIEKKISRLKKNREQYIDRVKTTIKQYFGDSMPDFESFGRMKHAYSIYRKMERQSISFEQVHDLFAFRILTKTIEECYEVVGHIHSLWKPVPGRFKDYIAMPKENNYRSLHTTVICLDGERVEFQIRTYAMHNIAENGIAAHWKYKDDGQLDMKSEETFKWLRQLVEWQKELKDSIEFLDTVKQDLFSSEVYIFTPQGDVRALPYGATPIDFAYSIHSDIGTHCAGARVNEKMVPLNHILGNGDEVEIITNVNRHPTKDWLNMVASSRAKARIRQFLKLEQREKSVSLGKNIFEEECDKHHLKPSEIIKLESFISYLKKKGLSDVEHFYSEVAYGKASVPILLSRIMPENQVSELENEGLISKIFKKVSKQTKNLVKISGIDEILVTFGKCCSPLPGDEIVGFVTRGRGVTVHRVECLKVPATDPQRRVNATWNTTVKQERIAKLNITCENKTGMLANIAQAISEKKVNITKAIIRTTRDEKAIIFLHVTVTHIRELHSIIKAVEKIKGVISVDREMG